MYDLVLLILLNQRALPHKLKVDGPLHRVERVHVLHLNLGPKLRRAALPDGHVDVAPHGSLGHISVGDADAEHDAPELGGVHGRLLPGPHVRLGDNLKQRDAASVVIDLGRLCARESVRADVDELAGVLLHVGARDADPLRPLLRNGHVNEAAVAQRNVILRDLIAFWEIGIEVSARGGDGRGG